MHDYIKERTIRDWKLCSGKNAKNGANDRKRIGNSKSTVHKDLTERLPEINAELAKQVKEILEYHKSVRHIRGGEATRRKYEMERLKQKQKKQKTQTK